MKNLILSCLSDGKQKTTNEIKTFIQKNGASLDTNSSLFRTCLYNLKKENPLLKNPKKGVYYLESSSNINNKKFTIPNIDNFEDFEDVLPIPRRNSFLVASVLKDDTLCINSHLLSFFPNKIAGIKIKKDASQLILIPNGEPSIQLGKNGRTKNYYLSQKLAQCHKKLPVYYVGEWDDEKNYWVGVLSLTNPNKTKK